MIKVKTLIGLGGFLFLAGSINGQQAKDFGAAVGTTNFQDFSSMQMRESLVNAIMNNSKKPQAEEALVGVQGSPYYEEQFNRGNLFYKNEALGAFYLRYNAFQDQLEIKKSNLKEENYQFLLQSDEIKSVVDGRELQYLKYLNEDGSSGNHYLYKEFAGTSYTLYSKKDKKYIPGRQSSNSLAQSIPDKFVDQKELLYATAGDQQIRTIPKSTKRLLQIFAEDKRKTIKEFIRKNRLRSSNTEDLVQIFIYADTL
ncbi:MAG: hypothetical protein AAF361_11430 [Bacteroidota bacterium]